MTSHADFPLTSMARLWYRQGAYLRVWRCRVALWWTERRPQTPICGCRGSSRGSSSKWCMMTSQATMKCISHLTLARVQRSASVFDQKIEWWPSTGIPVVTQLSYKLAVCPSASEDRACWPAYTTFVYLLAFPADIGRKPALPAHGSRQRIYAGAVMRTRRLKKRPTAQHGGASMECERRK